MQRGAWKRKACRGWDCCTEREEIVSWIFGVGAICWQSPIFLNADLSNISAPESLTDNIAFVGTWNPATLTADDKTVLYLQSDNTLYYPTADTPAHDESGHGPAYTDALQQHYQHQKRRRQLRWRRHRSVPCPRMRRLGCLGRQLNRAAFHLPAQSRIHVWPKSTPSCFTFYHQ